MNFSMNVTLDGTDFRIYEPTPFSSLWYSHKFKAAGVRYEIGISIGNGDIVWASGGFPCGEWTDLKIAKDLYVECVTSGEITLADEGYPLQKYFKQPSNEKEFRLLSRHETLNGRLKNFEILNCRFRHPFRHRLSHRCYALSATYYIKIFFLNEKRASSGSTISFDLFNLIPMFFQFLTSH